MTEITYTYDKPETEIPVIPNISLNESGNITSNISVNYTINQTNISLNISQNLTLNYSLNLTTNETNISTNLSLFNLTNITYTNFTNITLVNETNLSINITPNITVEFNYTYDIEKYNSSLTNLKLLNHSINTVKVGSGINLFTINAINLSLLRTYLIDTNDERLTSRIFSVENSQGGEVKLSSGSADVILKCTQFNNSQCKQWQERCGRGDAPG